MENENWISQRDYTRSRPKLINLILVRFEWAASASGQASWAGRWTCGLRLSRLIRIAQDHFDHIIDRAQGRDRRLPVAARVHRDRRLNLSQAAAVQDDDGFRLGVIMGIKSRQQLDGALVERRTAGGRVGDALADNRRKAAARESRCRSAAAVGCRSLLPHR